MTENLPSPSPRTFSGLGIAAVGIGIVAFIICWIPAFGIFAFPIAALGLVIAIIGYVVARRANQYGGIGLPIIGALVAGLVILGLFFMEGGSIAAMNRALHHSLQTQPGPTAPVGGSPINGNVHQPSPPANGH